eukprot:scaffold100034_cov69-Phaeocystis_antarctica.AAC.2
MSLVASKQPSIPTTDGCMSRPAAAQGAACRMSRITSRSVVNRPGVSSGTANAMTVLQSATRPVMATMRLIVPRAAPASKPTTFPSFSSVI